MLGIKSETVCLTPSPDTPKLKQCTRMHGERVGSVRIRACGDHRLKVPRITFPGLTDGLVYLYE